MKGSSQVNKRKGYYKVKIIQKINSYFSSFEERVLTNKTFFEIWKESYEKSKENSYGGIPDLRQSNSFIAKDLEGNIVATSTYYDYFIIAECTKREILFSHQVEYYEIIDKDFVRSYYPNHYQKCLVKNIQNEEDMAFMRKIIINLGFYFDNILYIFNNGSIMAEKSSVDGFQQIGQYDFSSEHFQFTDENYYLAYLTVTAPIVNSSCSVESDSSGNQSYRGWTPILFLKEGTYIIEEIRSSSSCQLPKNLKIQVSENLSIEWKESIIGYIVQSFQHFQHEDEMIGKVINKIIREPSGMPDTAQNVIKEEIGSFHNLCLTIKTYSLNDYTPLTEQTTLTPLINFSELNNQKAIEYQKIGQSCLIATKSEYFEPTFPKYNYFLDVSANCGYPSFSKNFNYYLDRNKRKYYGTDPSFIVADNHPYCATVNFHLRRIRGENPKDEQEFLNQLPSIEEIEKTILKYDVDRWLFNSTDANVNSYFGLTVTPFSGHPSPQLLDAEDKEITCFEEEGYSLYSDQIGTGFRGNCVIKFSEYKDYDKELFKNNSVEFSTRFDYLEDKKTYNYKNYATCGINKIFYQEEIETDDELKLFLRKEYQKMFHQFN